MKNLPRKLQIDSRGTRNLSRAVARAGLESYVGFNHYCDSPVIDSERNDCSEFEIGENGYLFTNTPFNEFAKILGLNTQNMVLRFGSKYASRVFTLSSHDGKNYETRTLLTMDSYLFELQLSECNNPVEKKDEDKLPDHPLVSVVQKAFGFRPQSYLTVSSERHSFNHPIISEITNRLEKYCVINARDSKNQIYCVKKDVL